MLNGAAIDAASKLQSVVAVSTAEAEYIALSHASTATLSASKILQELGYSEVPVTIYEDNEACIKIPTNEVCSSKARHVDIRYHAIRSYIEKAGLSASLSLPRISWRTA